MSLRSVPRAAWACVLLAIVNACCWAVLTPTFWVPDEPAHSGYAQYVAETGELPTSKAADKNRGASGEQSLVFAGLPFGSSAKPSWLPLSDVTVKRKLNGSKLSRSNPGQALNATANPPLYYLLTAIPYRAAYSGDYLDRLMAMRLFSALFAGLTVLFVFMFLRQVLPGRPWTWAVGGLVVAFNPLLGFMAGGVNNDPMIYAVGAALLWGIARAFRQGLNVSTGVHIGLVMAVGLLTKATALGLVPGLLVALVMMLLRDHGRQALLGAGALLVLTVVPYQVFGFFQRARLAESILSGPAMNTPPSGLSGIRDQLSYAWQVLLPKLPFMEEQVDGYPLWDVYYKGFVGRFGWFEYDFPAAWYWVALPLFVAIVVLAGRALWNHRSAVRPRRAELVAYGAISVGLLLAVEKAAYDYRVAFGAPFEQTRYLFPLLALYGGVVALAAIGAGPRWGRALGGFLVVLAMGHSLFAQLLTLARFYN